MIGKSARWPLALVLVAALAGSAAAANGKRILGHVPADCRGVAVINVERAVSSKHWSHIRDALSRTDEFKKGLSKLEAAGFKLERDLKTVVAAFPEGALAAGTRSLVLVEGRFDSGSVKVALASLGSKGARKYGGASVYSVGGGRSVAVQGSIIVFGTTQDVERSIDVAAGRKRSLRKSGLAKALVRSINRNADFWMVADAGSQGMGPVPGASPRAIAVSVDLGRGGVGIRATLDSGSTASAQQMVQSINMGSAMLKNDDSMKSMGLSPVLQKLKVLGDGPRVQFAVDLTDVELTGMMPLFEMMKSQI